MLGTLQLHSAFCPILEDILYRVHNTRVLSVCPEVCPLSEISLYIDQSVCFMRNLAINSLLNIPALLGCSSAPALALYTIMPIVSVL